MPRFFFNVVCRSGIAPDPEGTDLPDLDDARREAIEDARALMSEAIRHGRDISGRAMQICGDDGAVLLTVSFSEGLQRFD